MKEALIILNLVVGASFLVLLSRLVCLRIRREVSELELLAPQDGDEALPIHDLLYAKEQD